MNKRIITFLLIMLIAVMSQLSVDNYLPSLPYLTTLFHSTAATLRLTVIVFMLGAGIAAFFFGIASDRLGRKRSIITALICFLLGNLLCSFAMDTSFLFVGRFLQGLGVGGVLTLTRVILCDITEDQTELARFGSYLSTVISIVPAISPTLGAYIFVHLGWRTNFILLLVATGISLILIRRLLPETYAPPQQHLPVTKILTDIKEIFSTSVFNGFLLCAGLITASALALMSVGPHLFQTSLHLTPIEYGYVTFFVGLAMVCGSYSNALLVKYIGLRNTVSVGLFVIIISSAALLSFYFLGYINVMVILIPAMFYLYGGDFISSNAYAGAVSTLKDKSGTATALYTSSQMLFAGIIGIVVAYLPDNNQFPLGMMFFIIALVITAIIMLFLRKRLETKVRNQ